MQQLMNTVFTGLQIGRVSVSVHNKLKKSVHRVTFSGGGVGKYCL